MKVFISWSGESSRSAAHAIHDWLPSVLQHVQPWISDQIPTGDRWREGLMEQLEDHSFGILCITRANMMAPWILFEAGVLARRLPDAKKPRVAVLLFDDVTPSDLASSPLALFQMMTVSEEDLKRLIVQIDEYSDPSIGSQRAATSFDRWWPDLRTKLEALDFAVRDAPAPSVQDEILITLRTLVDEVRSITNAADGSSTPITVLPTFSKEFPYVYSMQGHSVGTHSHVFGTPSVMYTSGPRFIRTAVEYSDAIASAVAPGLEMVELDDDEPSA